MKQMTLIEMNGFLKGKCIPRDLKVNETNAEYLVRKFGELESKLETALRECRSAGITIDNLEAKCSVLLDELEAAEKRIAELEARGIRLPERSSMLHRTDFNEDYQTVMAYKVSDVIAAIRAAGIRIKGE